MSSQTEPLNANKILENTSCSRTLVEGLNNKPTKKSIHPDVVEIVEEEEDQDALSDRASREHSADKSSDSTSRPLVISDNNEHDFDSGGV